MKTLLIDPYSGIAGDMFTAALLDLKLFDHDLFFETLKSLNIPGCIASAEKILKNGIGAHKFNVTTSGGIEGPGGEFEKNGKKTFIPLTKVDKKKPDVKLDHSHEHHSLTEVIAIINNSSLPENVKELSVKVFTELGKAEAFIHDKNLQTVHFHEVGAADAIMDICAGCLAVTLINPDKIVCRKVAVGGGTVKTAHGILPVPAPATAKLLEGVTTFCGPAEKELTTPTGAALLKALCHEFSNGAEGVIKATGYGAGTLNFKTHANLLKITVLETEADSEFEKDTVTAITTNIDDMPGEHLTSIIPELMKAGALDVTCTPCMMKKGRQGFTLEVLCLQTEVDKLSRYILTHTSSFGVRLCEYPRLKLKRKVIELDTAYGKLFAKAGYINDKIIKISPEYEECLRLSKEQNIPVTQIYSAVHAVSLSMIDKN